MDKKNEAPGKTGSNVLTTTNMSNNSNMSKPRPRILTVFQNDLMELMKILFEYKGETYTDDLAVIRGKDLAEHLAELFEQTWPGILRYIEQRDHEPKDNADDGTMQDCHEK